MHRLWIISLLRFGFFENVVSVNWQRVFVKWIGYVRLLSETLKTFKWVWFKGGKGPIKWFEFSSRDMRFLSRSNSTGSEPVRLLNERVREASLSRMRNEEGNEVEKWLWSIKRDFRLTNGERSGIGPNSELLLRFMILSSTSCDKLFGGNTPWRFKLSTSYCTTFPFSHVTPFQSQKLLIDSCVYWSWLFVSAPCSKDNKARDSRGTMEFWEETNVNK
jgi:hypothetical protein